jgi:hypothetical protein
MANGSKKRKEQRKENKLGFEWRNKNSNAMNIKYKKDDK